MKETQPTWIRNPMTLLALLIGLTTEIGLGVGLSDVPEAYRPPFAAFMIGFPLLYTIGFFLVLFFRPSNLYAPIDFRTDEAFLSLNRRAQDAHMLAEVVDKKIESMPLYRYPKLPECAKLLFLSIYDQDTGIDHRSAGEIVADLATAFPQAELDAAVRQVAAEGWLTRKGDSLLPTTPGSQAYRVVSEFVYGRWK